MDEDILAWLIPLCFYSIPTGGVLMYIISAAGWIFSPKGSKQRDKFNTLSKVSSKIIIGWFIAFALFNISVIAFALIFGLPQQQ